MSASSSNLSTVLGDPISWPAAGPSQLPAHNIPHAIPLPGVPTSNANQSSNGAVYTSTHFSTAIATVHTNPQDGPHGRCGPFHEGLRSCGRIHTTYQHHSQSTAANSAGTTLESPINIGSLTILGPPTTVNFNTLTSQSSISDSNPPVFTTGTTSQTLSSAVSTSSSALTSSPAIFTTPPTTAPHTFSPTSILVGNGPTSYSSMYTSSVSDEQTLIPNSQCSDGVVSDIQGALFAVTQSLTYACLPIS